MYFWPLNSSRESRLENILTLPVFFYILLLNRFRKLALHANAGRKAEEMNNKKTTNAFLKRTMSLFILLFIVQNISAYTWKPVVVPAGGAIQDIVYSRVSQGLRYMRTDMGGAYRWDNANNIWVPLTDWLGDWNLYGVESIAPDPKNANVVYAAIGQSYNSSNGYIIVSSDQGSNWTQYSMPVIIAGNDSGNYAGERLAVDPDNTAILYYGSRSGGLWKSTNSGVNWIQVSSFPVNGDSGSGLSYVIFDPNSATGSGCSTIFVGVESLTSGNSNLYRSTNSGANWSVVPGGPSSMSTCQASLGSDRNLWIVYGNSNSGPSTGQVWKLNLNSLAWSNVSPAAGPGAGSGGYSGICVDAQNAQHAVVSTLDWWGGTDKCFQTTNGGTSWTIIANTQNSWNSGPYPVYNNNGAPWTRFCSTYDGGAWLIACVKIDPFNSNNAIYTTGGGLWSTTNVQASTQPQGITWTFTDYGIEQTAVLFLCPSYKSGVFFSCLGDISGMRYTNLDVPAPNKYCNPAFGNTNCLDFAENNTNIVARVGSSGSAASDTAFSSDNGQNWAPGTVAPPGYGTSNQMRSCAVAADGSRVIVCPYNGYGSPAYTTNSGGSWTTCNGLPSGSDLAADRVNASVFYATNGSNLYRSMDSGANFSQINSFSGSGAPRAVFGQTGEVWVTTGSGLYRFMNQGMILSVIPNVSSANSVGFGKAASGQAHPAVYLTGNVGGTYGFYRCDDGVGTAWVRINDNNHQYGYGAWCGGDEDIYGRMYVGTNGRGTLYCDSAIANTPTNTPVITNTATQTRTATLTFTGTPSFTPTPSCTKTNTPSVTSTPSSTYTATVTYTFTPTGSSTRTASPTSTCTGTRSFTPIVTPTLTNTPDNSPTETGTGTPLIPTNTPVMTETGTQISTASYTPVNTVTFTWSNTYTLTQTTTIIKTATPSVTATNTPVDTPAYTVTDTAQGTSTNTPFAPKTYTPANTSTSSVVPTDTGTPVNTASNTAVPSASNTPVSTVTNTQIPSATMTFTRTVSPSFTRTPASTSTLTSSEQPTLTSTATVSFTWTPAPATPTFTPTTILSDKLEIKDPVIIPNPYNPAKGDLNVRMNLTGKAVKMSIRVYTVSFRRVIEETQDISLYGLVNISFAGGKFNKLASGIYYVVIKGETAGGEKAATKSKVLIILR